MFNSQAWLPSRASIKPAHIMIVSTTWDDSHSIVRMIFLSMPRSGGYEGIIYHAQYNEIMQPNRN
ncbi:hypothetical protein CY34DRAFT_808144 [Suillus luteus UH-Slu-Lm8-n1]|uniref:Uncharacterized protein n=1 Tax=Suillus luteus UH-Slu-Lm8-n1 TaxID=930992 RepID=A0A0C9ZPJ4_9AGAM|nr:hypothetical protein CY34DRAFT_808144 [Suillus luteus UH-Slu-Lm8-n1]